MARIFEGRKNVYYTIVAIFISYFSLIVYSILDYRCARENLNAEELRSADAMDRYENSLW